MDKRGEEGPFGLSLTEIIKLVLAIVIVLALIFIGSFFYKAFSSNNLACQNEAEWKAVTNAITLLMEGKRERVEIPFYNADCKLIYFAPNQGLAKNPFLVQPYSARLLDQESKLCLCQIQKENLQVSICTPDQGKCFTL